MDKISDIIKKNQKDWNERVVSGEQYTIPWLNMSMDLINQFANGELSGFNKPYGKIKNPILIKIRKLLYSNLKGKRVLCLASGGGQQSVLFSLLGADVTVADISQGQLNGDIQAAKHYGYSVRTELCSMTDLSVFKDESFDIVYQPVSICFVPDVTPVYKEVYRVLKKGGLYQVDHINPATYPTSFDNDIDGWDGIGYRISSPYIGGALRIDENGNENMTTGEVDGEYRHLFIDMFCKLTDTGFQIKYIWEDERNLVEKTINQEEIVPTDETEVDGFFVVQRYIQIVSTK
jgi:ubiquinone/menaquinone biosynthesis C-methylase UbiE